jgi:two-component system nitrogen regulation response regulator NtrX
MVSVPIVDISHLPSEVVLEYENNIDQVPTEKMSGANYKRAKTDFEKTFLLSQLEQNNWNISKTADSIGVERSNLHRKLRNLGIDLKELKIEE